MHGNGTNGAPPGARFYSYPYQVNPIVYAAGGGVIGGGSSMTPSGRGMTPSAMPRPPPLPVLDRVAGGPGGNAAARIGNVTPPQGQNERAAAGVAAAGGAGAGQQTPTPSSINQRPSFRRQNSSGIGGHFWDAVDYVLPPKDGNVRRIANIVVGNPLQAIGKLKEFLWDEVKLKEIVIQRTELHSTLWAWDRMTIQNLFIAWGPPDPTTGRNTLERVETANILKLLARQLYNGYCHFSGVCVPKPVFVGETESWEELRDFYSAALRGELDLLPRAFSELSKSTETKSKPCWNKLMKCGYTTKHGGEFLDLRNTPVGVRPRIGGRTGFGPDAYRLLKGITEEFLEYVRAEFLELEERDAFSHVLVDEERGTDEGEGGADEDAFVTSSSVLRCSRCELPDSVAREEGAGAAATTRTCRGACCSGS
eukprot:g20044.t1